VLLIMPFLKLIVRFHWSILIQVTLHPLILIIQLSHLILPWLQVRIQLRIIPCAYFALITHSKK
jgi:hypothetical protein